MNEDLIHFRREENIKTYKDFLKNKLFLEFGVCTGKSMLEYYGLYSKYEVPASFYGFDSFEGLPEEPNDPLSSRVWRVGEFTTNKNINPDLFNKPNLNLKVGWFSDTLNKDLLEEFGENKVGFIHMDCDIYTSTYNSLDFLLSNNLIADGAIIVYDDWGGYRQAGLDESQEYALGENRAHKEICEKYNLKYETVAKDIIDPNFYEIATFVLKFNI
jgi:hypothetical protein